MSYHIKTNVRLIDREQKKEWENELKGIKGIKERDGGRDDGRDRETRRKKVTWELEKIRQNGINK